METRLKDLRELIEQRINILRKIPEDDCIKSNCHGTVLYLLGFKEGELPGLVYEKEMTRFLENQCQEVEIPRETDIATIWDKICYQVSNEPPKLNLGHSAILVHPASERIYHQRETGDVFEFSTINRYLIENFPRPAIRQKRVFPRFYRYLG